MKRTEHNSQTTFPVKPPNKALDGFTISGSTKGSFWFAVVVLEEPTGKKDIRLYKWEKRNGEWKVGLAKNSLLHWNLYHIAREVDELKRKWEIDV